MKKHRNRDGKSRKSRGVKSRKIRPPRVQYEFTDLSLTEFGGASVLADTTRQLALFDLLSGAVSVKKRDRSATDVEMMWAMIASFARGHGSLSDLDALRADRGACALLGLGHAPGARRAGEWLSRLKARDAKGIWNAGVRLVGRVAPSIIAHEVETKRYVPLFITPLGSRWTGTCSSVRRRTTTATAGIGCMGRFWGVFGRWASCSPAGGRVTLNWRKQLHWTAGMIAEGTSVWVRADNTYYKGDSVRECRQWGWDYSISLTNDRCKRPVLDQIKGLPDSA